MKIYSDFSPRRTGQIIADVVGVGVIALSIWIAASLHALISGFASFGADMEASGAGFRETMTDVGDTLGGVPLIGGGIRGPFDAASDAGATLESAGQDQQVFIGQFATASAIAVVVIPLLVLGLVWVLPRVRFIRRASEAAALLDGSSGSPVDLDWLALRSLSRAPLATITAIEANPAAAWRRGDPDVIRRLAELELRSAGVRLP